MCQIFSAWKNQYGNRDATLTEEYDVVTFATTGGENKRVIIRRK